jgi:hypothetical protein
MATMHELFDGSDSSLIPAEAADEWLDKQESGVAACDHLTFARKVWEAAQQAEREACAKVCMKQQKDLRTRQLFASAIRARSNVDVTGAAPTRVGTKA